MFSFDPMPNSLRSSAPRVGDNQERGGSANRRFASSTVGLSAYRGEYRPTDSMEFPRQAPLQAFCPALSRALHRFAVGFSRLRNSRQELQSRYAQPTDSATEQTATSLGF